MGEGEKKEVVVEKKKEEVITIVYRLHIHCDECARVVERHITQHEGVRKVEIDSAKGLVTVRGVGIDVTKLKERIERKTRKKIELLSPLPKKEEKKEEKKVEKKEEKKVEIKTINVRVYMHCGRCESFIKEQLLKHKDIYTVKTNREKHICTITGVIEEKKLIEYIRATTRKHGEIIKEEKKVVKEEEKVKVEAKVGKDGVKVEITEKKEKEEIKSKDVVVPYFIPCTHPTFMNFSHPDFFNHKYPPFHYVDYSHLDIKSYQYPPFVHCSHPPECFSEENPYACSVM
ncbi:heavy metal-associated isoprenylated plant protein 4-like [Ananas comosus]|uniref:Heavy metal-associated isoprenylated plant protein 4-like n=1 Tax=Ananas comosus TaxID=4615 RepID=A0A6P5EUU2_ANACO|nr:heavy metal-associated isoprenylated plant protein 4-like [Ananas comosus]